MLTRGSQGAGGLGAGESPASRLGPVPFYIGNLPVRREASQKALRTQAWSAQTRQRDPARERPWTSQVGLLTVSPLNRTNTRAGGDPPSSRRAASIAGAGRREASRSPPAVTFTALRLRTRHDRDARRRTGGTSRALTPGRAPTSPRRSRPALGPASSRERGGAGSALSGAEAAGM